MVGSDDKQWDLDRRGGPWSGFVDRLRQAKEDRSAKGGQGGRRRAWGLAVLALLALVLLGNTVYTVDAGERAVIFDKTDGSVATVDQGLHFKVPFLQERTIYDVKSRIETADASAASKDLQQVTTRVTVQFKPDPARVAWLHENIGTEYLSKVIRPAVQESMKTCTAKYSYEELIQRRELPKQCIIDILDQRLARSNILFEEISLEDFTPPEDLRRAIDAKEKAKQEALEELNRLEATKARAQQQVAQANGTARSISIINEQLATSPKYVEYLYAQTFRDTWDGRLPTYMAGDEVPLLQIPVPAPAAS